MHESANVTSTGALEDFRNALAIFMDQAKDALVTIDMDIRRTLDWLDDQTKVWKSDIRVAENAVHEAKTQLARKKMMRINDRPPDTIEEEKALKRAVGWLEFAEDKLKNTKRWLIHLPEEIKEYEGPAKNFQSILEIELPHMLDFLAAKIEALEAYQRLAPPSGR